MSSFDFTFSLHIRIFSFSFTSLSFLSLAYSLTHSLTRSPIQSNLYLPLLRPSFSSSFPFRPLLLCHIHPLSVFSLVVVPLFRCSDISLLLICLGFPPSIILSNIITILLYPLPPLARVNFSFFFFSFYPFLLTHTLSFFPPYLLVTYSYERT